MAIDPSIALNVRPVQIDNPLDAYAKVAQVQSMRDQNRLAALMFGEKQRAAEEGNALRNLLSDQANYDEAGNLRRAALPKIGAVAPGQYGDYQKQIAAQEKAAIESQKVKLETGLKQFEAVAQIMSGVKDQASYDVARQEIAAIVGPEAAAKIHPVYDPAVIEQNKVKALSVKDQMEQRWKELEYKLNTDKFAYQQKHDATTLAETVRNNNMTDARGRQANALKAQENQINQQGIVGKKIQDVELKLQDDYRNESKGFSETSTAMKKVLGSIDVADKNPGAALAAGTAFMKLLDPNSVVRESELGMALNASGWFDRAMNIANTLQAGKVMTPKQKENLKKASETLFEEAKAAQREIDAAYEQRARAYGAEPSRVIVDRGQRNTASKGQAKPSPASGGGKVVDFNDL